MGTLSEFFKQNRAVIRVALTRVRGSSPREAGTESCWCRPDRDVWGTIGGGQLEYHGHRRRRAPCF